MCDEEWDGQTERRTGFCPVHHIKCDEWKSTEEKVNILERNKVSFVVLKIIITIVLSLGGTYWYYQDTVNREKFGSMLRTQTVSTDLLNKHVDSSNKLLKRMSHDVREMKLNLQTTLKRQNLEYQRIPGYYGDDNGAHK